MLVVARNHGLNEASRMGLVLQTFPSCQSSLVEEVLGIQGRVVRRMHYLLPTCLVLPWTAPDYAAGSKGYFGHCEVMDEMESSEDFVPNEKVQEGSDLANSLLRLACLVRNTCLVLWKRARGCGDVLDCEPSSPLKFAKNPESFRNGERRCPMRWIRILHRVQH